MLTDDDKEKIIVMRKKKYSYEKIHDKSGFSIDKIMKVCKEYEQDLLREPDDEKNVSKKEKKDQTTKETLFFDSITDYIRKIPEDFDNKIKEIINKGHQKTKEIMVLKKQIDQIRELLRTEVDERIIWEIADAIKKNNEKWELIKKEKDNLISKYQDDISRHITKYQEDTQDLNNTINNRNNEILKLTREIDDLIKENKKLKYDIEYRLDEEIREPLEDIKNKEIKFEKFIKENQIVDENRSLKLEKREIEVEIREKKATERETQLNHEKNNFYNKSTQFDKKYNELLHNLIIQDKNITEKEIKANEREKQLIKLDEDIYNRKIQYYKKLVEHSNKLEIRDKNITEKEKKVTERETQLKKSEEDFNNKKTQYEKNLQEKK